MYSAVSGPRGVLVAKLLIYICIDFLLVANLLNTMYYRRARLYIVIYKLNELKKFISRLSELVTPTWFTTFVTLLADTTRAAQDSTMAGKGYVIVFYIGTDLIFFTDTVHRGLVTHTKDLHQIIHGLHIAAG